MTTILAKIFIDSNLNLQIQKITYLLGKLNIETSKTKKIEDGLNKVTVINILNNFVYII